MVDLPTEEQKIKVKVFMESRRDWTQWQSERLLGCSRHSIVGLFSRNRMFKSKHFDREYQYAVVKETDHYQHYLERGELPEEVMALTKLKPFNCTNIIKLIKWGPLPKLEDVYVQKYRIYTEFCQYGDLGRLLYRHRRYGRYLVEPFLWNMFFHLAKALVVLEHGPESRNLLRKQIEDGKLSSEATLLDEKSPEPKRSVTESSASKHWKPIVHNDIKPQNIFLGDEDLDTFSFYPTAKLGDFGNAFLYTPGESQEAVMLGGTNQYQPPDDVKGPWSNVYGVGVSMYEAVTLEDHTTSGILAREKQKRKMKEGSTKFAGSESSDSSHVEDYHRFDWECGGRTPCSRRLELLILRCMRTNVTDRITARELLLETRKALSEVRHELKNEYGLDAGPMINSEGKKEPKRLPDGYQFKLHYHGSELEGTPYGNYVCNFRKPPYLQDYYFPELYKEGPEPMRFPMRASFYSKTKNKNLDHFRMPWETADEWNARERGWPGDDESGDEGSDEDSISLYSVEQPASNADEAGHEWLTDSDTNATLREQRAAESRAWRAEAKQKKADYTHTKNKAERELARTLNAKQKDREKKNKCGSVPPPPEKRRKLTSGEAGEREWMQAEELAEEDETETETETEAEESEDEESEDEESEDEDEDDGRELPRPKYFD